MSGGLPWREGLAMLGISLGQVVYAELERDGDGGTEVTLYLGPGVRGPLGGVVPMAGLVGLDDGQVRELKAALDARGIRWRESGE